MRRRNNGSSSATTDENWSNNKRNDEAKQEGKIHLPKKIGSFISQGLGRKKSRGMSSSRAETVTVNASHGALNGCIEVSVTRILPGHDTDESRSLRSDTRGTNSRNMLDLIFPVAVPRTPSLSISWSFNEKLLGKFNNAERSANACKRVLKICSNSRRFLSNRIGINHFSKWKVSHRNSGNLDSVEDTSDTSCACDETSDTYVNLKKISRILLCFPCRKTSGYRKIKTQTIIPSSIIPKIQKIKTRKFVLRKSRRKGDDTKPGDGKAGGRQDRGRVELCRKRILMGGRCRPLNLSGRLHYDENGFLLPEEVIFSEEF